MLALDRSRKDDNSEANLATKKRPKLFSLGRPGSPPPELPNHNWILWRVHCAVNVTLVIAVFRCVTSSGFSESKRFFGRFVVRRKVGTQKLLLFFPALTSVRSGPGFVACGGQFSVLIILKLNANDV